VLGDPDSDVLLVHEVPDEPKIPALETVTEQFQRKFVMRISISSNIGRPPGRAPRLRPHPAPASPSGTVMLVHDRT
jgi:hypothetical protein